MANDFSRRKITLRTDSYTNRSAALKLIPIRPFGAILERILEYAYRYIKSRPILYD